jgi:protocatechuate 3,4-dioxygenase beta subunit
LAPRAHRRIAAAGLLLALLAALAFSPRGGGRGDAPAGRPLPDVTASPPPAPARRQSAIPAWGVAPAVPVDPATPAEKPPVVLEIRVLHPDGTPAGGAEVRVYESDPSQDGFMGKALELPPRRGRGIADKEGRVRMEVPGALGGGFVSAFHGDEAATSDRAVHLEGGARHEVELRLEPSHRLSGTVVDSRDQPVPGASLLLLIMDEGGTMSSSIGPYDFAVPPERMEQGSFEFAPLGVVGGATPMGWTSLRLRVHAEGHLPAVFPVPSDAPARGPLIVRLQGMGRLRGRCIDSRGRPAVGAVVRWLRCRDGTVEPLSEVPSPAISGDDGRFEMAGVPEGGGEVRIRAPGFGPVSFPAPAFEASRGGDLGDFVLPSGETVTGRVVDPDGAPVPGAAVHLEEIAVSTDADGRFTLRDAPPPPWNLRASERPVGALEGRRGSLVLHGRTRDEVRICLSEERLVRVEIEFAPGREPVLRRFWTYVNLRRKGESLYEKTNIHWGRTSFRLKAEGLGEYEVELDAGDYGRVVLPVVVGADREAVIRAILPPPESGE